MKVFHASELFWDVVDGQVVVCKEDSGELFKLNQIASFLWVACEKTTLLVLTNHLKEAYPRQEFERIQLDVIEFVNSMLEFGLLIKDE
jgi:hypothetical protein